MKKSGYHQGKAGSLISMRMSVGSMIVVLATPGVQGAAGVAGADAATGFTALASGRKSFRPASSVSSAVSFGVLPAFRSDRTVVVASMSALFCLSLKLAQLVQTVATVAMVRRAKATFFMGGGAGGMVDLISWGLACFGCRTWPPSFDSGQASTMFYNIPEHRPRCTERWPYPMAASLMQTGLATALQPWHLSRFCGVVSRLAACIMAGQPGKARRSVSAFRPGLQPSPKLDPSPIAFFMSSKPDFTFSAKLSTFGGPHDKGVAFNEGLAVYPMYDTHAQRSGLFLADQPPGTTGPARRLNPEAMYVAIRFAATADHMGVMIAGKGVCLPICTPLQWLRENEVFISADQGKTWHSAKVADWGPNGDTRRGVDMSPGLAHKLGVPTDAMVLVRIPGAGR